MIERERAIKRDTEGKEINGGGKLEKEEIHTNIGEEKERDETTNWMRVQTWEDRN